MSTANAPQVIAAIDLAAFDHVDTTDVVIVHPATKEPIGLTITVMGSDSEAYQKLQRAKINRRLKQKNRKPLTAEQIDEEATQDLAHATLGWSQNGQPTALVGGKHLPCEYDNVVALYNRLPFIKEQVDAAIGDRSLFIKS